MAEKTILNKGTVERLVIDVNDRLDSINDLDGLSPVFDIKRLRDGNWIVQGKPATNSNMRVFCLIDTTLDTFDVSGNFELYLQFTNGQESPRLGPFSFELVGAPSTGEYVPPGESEIPGYAWQPLTTIVGGEPELVWDENNELVLTYAPINEEEG